MVLISVTGCQLKNPMTSGIEPVTFRLKEKCLNQLRYRVALSPEEINGTENIMGGFTSWRHTLQHIFGLLG
jgi:hypothetical protein